MYPPIQRIYRCAPPKGLHIGTKGRAAPAHAVVAVPPIPRGASR